AFRVAPRLRRICRAGQPRLSLFVIPISHHNSLFYTPKLTLLTENPAHGITDLSQSSICFYRLDYQWHQISTARCPCFKRGQNLLDPLIVTPLAQFRYSGSLSLARLRIDTHQRWLLLVFMRKAVHPHYDCALLFESFLIRVCCLLDLCLYKALLDG